MSAEKIIAEWKKKVFKPIYWLEGEEDYYIDKVCNMRNTISSLNRNPDLTSPYFMARTLPGPMS